MTDVDITEFLTARYDEEQRLAEEASRPGMGAEWHAAGTGADGRFVADATQGAGSWGVARFSFAAQGAHAIYWDPARVLADIAAKRAIIAEHGNVNDGHCDTCVVGDWGYPTHGGSHPQSWPCKTLRHLAAPYAEHSDYDPGWRI